MADRMTVHRCPVCEKNIMKSQLVLKGDKPHHLACVNSKKKGADESDNRERKMELEAVSREVDGGVAAETSSIGPVPGTSEESGSVGRGGAGDTGRLAESGTLDHSGEAQGPGVQKQPSDATDRRGGRAGKDKRSR